MSENGRKYDGNDTDLDNDLLRNRYKNYPDDHAVQWKFYYGLKLFVKIQHQNNRY